MASSLRYLDYSYTIDESDAFELRQTANEYLFEWVRSEVQLIYKLYTENNSIRFSVKGRNLEVFREDATGVLLVADNDKKMITSFCWFRGCTEDTIETLGCLGCNTHSNLQDEAIVLDNPGDVQSTIETYFREKSFGHQLCHLISEPDLLDGIGVVAALNVLLLEHIPRTRKRDTRCTADFTKLEVLRINEYLKTGRFSFGFIELRRDNERGVLMYRNLMLNPDKWKPLCSTPGCLTPAAEGDKCRVHLHGKDAWIDIVVNVVLEICGLTSWAEMTPSHLDVARDHIESVENGSLPVVTNVNLVVTHGELTVWRNEEYRFCLAFDPACKAKLFKTKDRRCKHCFTTYMYTVFCVYLKPVDAYWVGFRRTRLGESFSYLAALTRAFNHSLTMDSDIEELYCITLRDNMEEAASISGGILLCLVFKHLFGTRTLRIINLLGYESPLSIDEFPKDNMDYRPFIYLTKADDSAYLGVHSIVRQYGPNFAPYHMGPKDASRFKQLMLERNAQEFKKRSSIVCKLNDTARMNPFMMEEVMLFGYSGFVELYDHSKRLVNHYVGTSLGYKFLGLEILRAISFFSGGRSVKFSTTDPAVWDKILDPSERIPGSEQGVLPVYKHV